LLTLFVILGALSSGHALSKSFARRARNKHRAPSKESAAAAEDSGPRILPLGKKALKKRVYLPLQEDASAAPVVVPPTAGDKDLAQHARRLLDSEFVKVAVEAFGKDAVQLQCFEPPVVTIEGFLDGAACDALRAAASDGKGYEVPSKTFSADTAGHRTSTSWFLNFRDCQAFVKQALRLMPEIRLAQMEEPQVVRYSFGQKFGWHGDALPKQLLAADLSDGGQRIATLLVYLNDVENGGSTVFKDLGLDGKPLKVKPEKGKALLFFPSNRAGEPDDRTEHQAEPALDEKWIAQMWIHEAPYEPKLPIGNSNEEAAVFGSSSQASSV